MYVCITVTGTVTDNLLRYSSYRKASPFPLSTRTVTSTLFKSPNYIQGETHVQWSQCHFLSTNKLVQTWVKSLKNLFFYTTYTHQTVCGVTLTWAPKPLFFSKLWSLKSDTMVLEAGGMIPEYVCMYVCIQRRWWAGALGVHIFQTRNVCFNGHLRLD